MSDEKYQAALEAVEEAIEYSAKLAINGSSSAAKMAHDLAEAWAWLTSPAQSH